MLKIVDLPTPFGPNNPRISPWFKLRLKSSNINIDEEALLEDLVKVYKEIYQYSAPIWKKINELNSE